LKVLFEQSFLLRYCGDDKHLFYASIAGILVVTNNYDTTDILGADVTLSRQVLGFIMQKYFN